MTLLKTHIISSKITKFIWFLGYCNFSKMNMCFETDGVCFNFLNKCDYFSYNLGRGVPDMIICKKCKIYIWTQKYYILIQGSC